MSFHDILVVGAGPVGLTSAIEASRKGFKVKIIDKLASSITKSNALAVNARSLEVLEASGVTKKIIEQGLNAQYINIVDKKFSPYARVAMKNTPSHINKSIILAQNRTEDLMRDHLYDVLGVEVQRETELIDFEELASPYEMDSENYFIKSNIKDGQGKEEIVYSKYLIGADGVHSKVRKTLGFQFEGFQVGHKLSLVDAQLVLPENYKDQFVIMLNPKKGASLIFFIPMGNGEYRIGSFADNIEDLLDRVPPGVMVKTVDWQSVLQSQVRQVKNYQKGHVFLAGDAAHCHSPVGGRGMNLGIEDACILIGLIKHNKTEIYTKLRHPVGKDVLEVSTGAFNFLQKSGFLVDFIKYVMFSALHWSPFLQSQFLKNGFGLSSPKCYDILS